MTRYEHLGTVTLRRDFFLPVYPAEPGPFSLGSILGIWQLDLSGRISIATFTESGFVCGFDSLACVRGTTPDGGEVSFVNLSVGLFGNMFGDDYCFTFLDVGWESPDRLSSLTFGGSPPEPCMPQHPRYDPSDRYGLLRATRIGSVPAP